MNSFDCVTAWHKYINPEFLRIYPHIQKAYDLTALHADKMSQIRGTHALTGLPNEVLEEFKKLDPETLSHAAIIVYYYGHFSPCKTAQKDGLYWKFKLIADAAIPLSKIDLLSIATHKVDRELDKYFIRSLSIKDYYQGLKL